MVPKIFLTGATGYIGGDAFHALYIAHPEYDYSVLVRNSDKGALVAADYPKVRLVYGDLDSADVLEEEASKADIVLHTADSSDHKDAARAIVKGIAKGHTAEKPGYWIHVSGTGILCWKDQQSKTLGEGPSSTPYDDLEGVTELTNLPDVAWHRDVDKIVLSAGSNATKTAIVCPPTIYGLGRGPGNQTSKQVYRLAKVTLENGYAPRVGKGLTEWDNVHVYDLSQLFVLLTEAAEKSIYGALNPALDKELWGERGYFLTDSGHHVWGEVSQWVADAAFARGWIKSKEVKQVDIKDTQGLTWGLNSKGHGKRARKFLGWEPKGKSLRDEIESIVEGEARALGLGEGGYAAKANGGK